MSAYGAKFVLRRTLRRSLVLRIRHAHSAALALAARYRHERTSAALRHVTPSDAGDREARACVGRSPLHRQGASAPSWRVSPLSLVHEPLLHALACPRSALHRPREVDAARPGA